MRYLVTGGRGFIGSHLADTLLKTRNQVTIVDDGRAPSVERVAGADHLDCSIAQMDDDAAKVDAIFHLASPVGPVGVLAQAGTIVPQMVADAERLAALAYRWDIPLIYVSTSEIYGQQQQPMNETAPRIIAAGSSARMEYAVGKLAAETMLLNRSAIDVRIIRPFNVAGSRQRGDKGFVIPRFVEQALRGQPLTLYLPGTQRRAFTHVLDIAEGVALAAWRGRRGDIYNLGNPDNERTLSDLATLIVQRAESESRIELVDPVALWGPAFRDAPDKIPSIAKAEQHLGWWPRRTLDEIVDDVIQEHRAAAA